jgi:valyl-tRNA synthetase
MSKSKGNILDPIDIIDGITLDALLAKRTSGLMQPKMAEKIEKATRREFPEGIAAFGADALRFTMAALAGHGRDIKFDLQRAEGYKNFCNKLWNATRFVLMNTESFSLLPPGEGAPQGWMRVRSRLDSTAALPDTAPDGNGAVAPQPKTDAERWILAQLAKTASEAEQHFASYRFDLLAQALYEFAWNSFCDWFVELAKPALNGDLASAESRAAADSTRHTLLYVLERLLALLHPLIPFVTEELWQSVAPKLGIGGDTIMLQAYPQAAELPAADADAEAGIEWLKAMVTALRRVRSELNVPPAKLVTLLLADGDANDRARVARFASELRFLNKLDRIEWLDDAASAPPAATAVVGALKLLVPLEGLVDLDAERARLDKEIARVAGEREKSEAKLGKFSEKVPAAVIEQERQRLADWTAQHQALQAQRQKL